MSLLLMFCEEGRSFFLGYNSPLQVLQYADVKHWLHPGLPPVLSFLPREYTADANDKAVERESLNCLLLLEGYARCYDLSERLVFKLDIILFSGSGG